MIYGQSILKQKGYSWIANVISTAESAMLIYDFVLQYLSWLKNTLHVVLNNFVH